MSPMMNLPWIVSVIMNSINISRQNWYISGVLLGKINTLPYIRQHADFKGK